jgi:type II secretory pathway pseudopilin PulG
MKKRRFTDCKKEHGFTMTELLVVIPLTSIILITLVGSLFIEYTNILAESARSDLRTTGQRLLINLQDELLFTIAYGEQADSTLSDPYAPSGGWTHSSDPQTLIINEVALDSTRRDEDRHIVRRALNNCETTPETGNPVAINNVIYFVQDEPGSNYDSLRKRTLTPTYGTCSIDIDSGDPCTPTTTTCLDNAKKTSCPAGNIGNGNCETEDSILSENVIDLDIKYFAENNVQTIFPSSADKVEITLVMGDKVFGKEIQTEVKHTIRKIN